MTQGLMTLNPSAYEGQLLCPRCGNDGNGRRFAICAEGYTHAESCATYRHSSAVCPDCESDFLLDEMN